MRTIGEIGDLWPRCERCKHIAQDHNLADCTTVRIGQCPTCNTHGMVIPCDCKGYVGPTLEEFKLLLTPQEIEKYKF
jgi:hypothetical protein